MVSRTQIYNSYWDLMNIRYFIQGNIDRETASGTRGLMLMSLTREAF